MDFITKYSESVLNGTKQTFYKASMTEPDNSMSIPEIIAKFTRGQGLQVPVREWTSGSAEDDSTDISEFLLGKQAAAAPAADPAAAPAADPAAAPAADPGADLVSAESALVGPAPGPVVAPARPVKKVVSGGPGESAYVIDS